MELVSKRLSLTELSWNDLELVHELNSHPETAEFNTLGIPDDRKVTREVMRRAIDDQQAEDRKHFCWIVRHASVFVGEIGMNVGPARYRRAEVYYSILPQHWRNGYATEALQTVIKFGFDILNLHRIEAGVAVENFASIRVLEKIGMTREGVGRKILPIRGTWVDNYSYSILDSDPGNY